MNEIIASMSEIEIVIYLLLFYFSGCAVSAIYVRWYNGAHTFYDPKEEKLRPGSVLLSWVLIFMIITFLVMDFVVKIIKPWNWQKRIDKFLNYD